MKIIKKASDIHMKKLNDMSVFLGNSFSKCVKKKKEP